MKKSFTFQIFSLLALCMLCFHFAQAQTTYTFSTYPVGVQYAVNEEHVLDNNVTLYTTDCHFTTQLRVYSSDVHNGYFITNALPYYIDSLGFNMGNNADTVNIYGSLDGSTWTLVGAINVTASSNEYADFGLDFGNNNYNFFKFDVAGTHQIRVKTMTLYYKATGPGGNSAAAPTFSPNGGVQYHDTTVTLSSVTPNATIYYTTDGSTPTNASTLYTAPIAVSQTTTIKAIAYATGLSASYVSSQTYTFPTAFATIATLKANGAANSTYRLTGDFTFVFNNSNYTYIQDTSAALLLYGSNITNTYNEGDVISGGLYGTYTVYNNQIELAPLFNPATASSNTGSITPTTVTIADLTANYSQYDAKLIRLQNVTLTDSIAYTAGTTGASITISQNGSSINIYNRFKTLDTTIAANTVTDITGFAAIYGTTIQIFPRSNADLIAEVVTPTAEAPIITATGETAGTANSYYITANIALSCTTPNATIYYTTDGTTPTESSTLFANAFDITTTTTVKAVAIANGYLNSNVSTLTITIAHPTVETPLISPISGTYADSVTFNIHCATEGAIIRYTTDDTEPTETSNVYNSPVTLYATATIRAKAFKTDWISSNTFYAVYTIVHEASLSVNPTTLTFNSANTSGHFTVSGVYLTAPVLLTCNDTHFTLSQDTIHTLSDNTTITVTFDGTEPATGLITISSDTLSAHVSLTATTTLPAPTFTPGTGTSDTALSITIADVITDAEIRYTTDGTTPSISSTLYTAPIHINTPGQYTYNAIAFKSGWSNSVMTSATYTIVSIEPEYHDTLTYYTGFEDAEGFTASTSYNNATVVYTGTAGTQWATIFGTPSVTAPISGAQSMQMRWYSNSATTLGSTTTNFDIQHATRVQFSAKSTNNLNVAVSYSTDGGNTFVTPTVFELGSTASVYSYTVSDSGQYDNVRLRFALILPTEVPTSTSRVYIDSVCIYTMPGLVSTTVDAPVISPNGGTCYDTVQVSITCPTNSAQIYYTLDGTTPTEASTLYATPFDITSTTTVKAKAFKYGYTPSNIATATYTFPTEVANIAAFKAANTATNSTVYKITGDLTFVYRNGRNMYVQDTTGALLVYDNSSIITTTYYEGDLISGGLYGTYTLYNGLVEMVPTANTNVSVNNIGTIVPEIVTIEAIEGSYYQYESKLVKIADVIFPNGGTYTTEQTTNLDIVQNGETMQCRNNHKTLDMTIPAGYNADVVGFILQYNGSYQIAPRNNDDIIAIIPDTVATPVIISTLDNQSASIGITCSTEDATIYYTTDGTEPTHSSTLYAEVFTLTTGTWTVKAIAVKDGMIDSPVATEQFTVSIDEHSLNQMISTFPNPTSGTVTISYKDLTVSRIELYTLTGQLIQSMSADPSRTTFSLENAANGLYFVKIIGNDFTSIQKISKH